jgi:signal transduction histidine kinase
VTGDRIADAGCTFRLLRRSALHDVPVFNGMHRFLGSLLAMRGARIAQIAVNLIGNACKYTPRGGQVRVALHFATETDPLNSILLETLLLDDLTLFYEPSGLEVLECTWE